MNIEGYRGDEALIRVNPEEIASVIIALSNMPEEAVTDESEQLLELFATAYPGAINNAEREEQARQDSVAQAQRNRHRIDERRRLAEIIAPQDTQGEVLRRFMTPLGRPPRR